MALTKQVAGSPFSVGSPGRVAQQVVNAEIVGDGSSYAAGGIAITASDWGLTKVNAVIPMGCGKQGSAGTALIPQWDRVNGKVILYKGNGTNPAQEAAGADFASTVVLSLLVIGE